LMNVRGAVIVVGPSDVVRSVSGDRSHTSTFSVTENDWLSATGAAPTVDVTDNGPASTNATAIIEMTADFSIGVFTITETLQKPVIYFLCSDNTLRRPEWSLNPLLHTNGGRND
jgi:hypothetical protein